MRQSHFCLWIHAVSREQRGPRNYAHTGESFDLADRATASIVIAQTAAP
jgi:hypothetical protein